jgi:branched-chain amino acid transport system permease protein
MARNLSVVWARLLCWHARMQNFTSLHNKTARYAATGALLLLPLVLQGFGDHWVRIADTCLLYVMMALGMNIVVGYAGLLDLGYVAFYAVGAYLFALLTSQHLPEHFVWVATLFPAGLHTPWWVVLPLAAVLAALLGAVLGAPTLKLRGDYLAIVTLGFGEIVRIFINNLGHPANITNGARGLGQIDSISFFGLDLGKRLSLDLVWGSYSLSSVTLYYYLFLALTVLTVAVCYRLQRSRIGRAWMAIRDDEVAAEAMGVNTRNMKLLAFALGASFGGVAGAMFGAFQSYVSPESFSLQESVMIVAMVVFGGIGHIPGVILGAVLLTALPEMLRYVVGPLQQMTDGRLDAGILRQLLIAVAMISAVVLRPRGLWPAPEHGKSVSHGKSLVARR